MSDNGNGTAVISCGNAYLCIVLVVFYKCGLAVFYFKCKIGIDFILGSFFAYRLGNLFCDFLFDGSFLSSLIVCDGFFDCGFFRLTGLVFGNNAFVDRLCFSLS